MMMYLNVLISPVLDLWYVLRKMDSSSPMHTWKETASPATGQLNQGIVHPTCHLKRPWLIRVTIPPVQNKDPSEHVVQRQKQTQTQNYNHDS